MYLIDIKQIAMEMLAEIGDADKRRTISDKIDQLSDSPLQRGKPLREVLKGFRSIRAAGRFRVVYEVTDAGRTVDDDTPGNVEGTVVVVGVGIRRAGKRNDVYAKLSRMIREF